MVTNMTFDNMTDGVGNVTGQSSGGAKFSEELLSQFGLYTAGQNLLSTQVLVCAIVGLPSNLASFVTLFKMKPMTSSMFFLMLLACVDFFVLFIKLIFATLILRAHYRVGTHACKFYFYSGSISVHYSIWITVALTVERFIAVWLPLKVANICTVKRAKITSSILFVILALLNIPYPVATIERQIPNGDWRCATDSRYGPFLMKWSWVDSTIFLFVPWPTLLICNVMIILGLRKSIQKKEQLTSSSGQSEETRRQQQSVTVMLIAVSVACFILLTPNAILFIYERYWEMEKDVHNYVAYVFLNALVYFLSNFNHAINFWLYVISGRRFRRVFIALITCRSTEKAVKGKASGVTAVSTVSTNWKTSKGLENSGFSKDEENNL